MKKSDKALKDARILADEVAKAINSGFYPFVWLGGRKKNFNDPIFIHDVDDIYSKVRHMTNFHVNATHPRDEGGMQSGPEL